MFGYGGSDIEVNLLCDIKYLLEEILRELKKGEIMEEERFDYEKDDATRFVDNLKDRVHDLYDKNEELKEEIERLNKGYCKFKEQCGKYAMCLRENQLKEIERLNNIINEIYMFLSQYTITHTWQKIVIEDTIKYIEELKGSGSNEQK